jgi:hypothetical protein
MNLGEKIEKLLDEVRIHSFFLSKFLFNPKEALD